MTLPPPQRAPAIGAWPNEDDVFPGDLHINHPPLPQPQFLWVRWGQLTHVALGAQAVRPCTSVTVDGALSFRIHTPPHLSPTRRPSFASFGYQGRTGSGPPPCAPPVTVPPLHSPTVDGMTAARRTVNQSASLRARTAPGPHAAGQQAPGSRHSCRRASRAATERFPAMGNGSGRRFAPGIQSKLSTHACNESVSFNTMEV